MTQPARQTDAARLGRPWKTISLFISSTFRDMHVERDELNNVVFPAIAEKLKLRRCRFEPIDLRVGVETDSAQTESERELKILKVCLAEIERSRPFLLILLGDRYGWVPGHDRIRAASSEAGFAPEDEGCSVTALEIEYGLLKKDPVQRRRCLLCLREPLPYAQMSQAKSAIYSDAYARDPGAADRDQRLKNLKAKIFADPELAAHRLPYALDWDENHQQPKTDSEHGIKSWGQKVEAALWALLDGETRAFASQEASTWQREEQFAIEEFVERLNSSFVGRKAIVQGALDFALSPTASQAAWGICFTGTIGSGKSALFAKLHHEVFRQPDVLLLAHAAGISPRAGQTEWMLRRWIGELHEASGKTAEVSENLKPEDLEELFVHLLHRVAAKRRVVVLVDALNQFIRTDRARTVSWLPLTWPANARFIATAVPGEETKSLAHHKGLTLVDIPLLDASESDAVAAQVYGHYHRQPNDRVLRTVMALRLPDGTVAAGNPLWLTLALDLLNQLDADDFSAAEAGACSSAGEQLRQVVLARAHNLSPDLEGLYGRLLARVEKVAGTTETRAFAALIALSRHGWREEDFEKLLPAASAIVSEYAPSGNHPQSPIGYRQFGWDALRFAILRRCFRAHLVKCGALAQWDFAHATLRQAVLAWLDNDWKGESTTDWKCVLCTCGADYLQSFSDNHALKKTELLWHILGTRDSLRAATYYASGYDVQSFMKLYGAIDIRLGRITLRGGDRDSSVNLAAYLLEDWTIKDRPLIGFVTGWLMDTSLPDVVREGVAYALRSELQEILASSGHLGLRQVILRATIAELARGYATNLEFSNQGRINEQSR